MVIPNNILEKMSATDRKSLGRVAGMTADEAITKANHVAEVKTHREIENWLRMRSILFIHSRTDRKSTIAAGWPDFTAMYDGRVACVEIKTLCGKLSEGYRCSLVQPIHDVSSGISDVRAECGMDAQSH